MPDVVKSDFNSIEEEYGRDNKGEDAENSHDAHIARALNDVAADFFGARGHEISEYEIFYLFFYLIEGIKFSQKEEGNRRHRNKSKQACKSKRAGPLEALVRNEFLQSATASSEENDCSLYCGR
jgi:hypothetical protein